MDVLTFIVEISWQVVILVSLIVAPWTARGFSEHLRTIKKDKNGVAIEFQSKKKTAQSSRTTSQRTHRSADITSPAAARPPERTGKGSLAKPHRFG